MSEAESPSSGMGGGGGGGGYALYVSATTSLRHKGSQSLSKTHLS